MSVLRGSVATWWLAAASCTGSLSYFPPDPGTDTGQPTSLGNPEDTTSEPTNGTSGPGVPTQLAVIGVDPSFGTTAGGQDLRLTGRFDATSEVFLGGEPATIVSRDDTLIVVTTPPAGAAGPVDVEVRSPMAAEPGVLTEGFTFYRDRRGEAGIIGMVGWYDVQGDYWTGDSSDFAFGATAFVDGASDWEYVDGFAELVGGCRYQVGGTSWPADPALLDLDVPRLTLVGDTTQFDLDDGAVQGGWFSADPSTNDLLAGNAYDLTPVVGTTAWPESLLRDAVEIPDGFTLISPYLDTEVLPLVGPQSTFTWNGSGGDYVLIQVRREYTLAGKPVEDRVTCGVSDTGSFTLPSGLWPQWYSGVLLYIQVGRATVRRQELPHDRSENRLAGIYWVFGAGEAF